MKKLILLITLFSILIPRELMLNTDDALSARNAHNSSQGFNIDRQNNTINDNSVREDITLFEWDFEGDLWSGLPRASAHLHLLLRYFEYHRQW